MAQAANLSQRSRATASSSLNFGSLRSERADERQGEKILFAVVYPSNRHVTAKVRAFAHFLAEIYPAKGWWPKIIARAKTRRHRARGGPSRRQRAVVGARR
jgi:hypothetical protein